MNPVLVKIGPFAVHWYGLLIVIGAVIAAWIATKEARRRGEDPEHAWNLLTWCLILGIIGARAYHVFSTPVGNFAGWAYYREHPIEAIAFWNGGFRGLAIYGAVAGGVLAVVLYTWRAKLSLLRWLDIPTPGLLVAQVVGRLGNRINQELYGPATNLPWAFHINPTYPCQEPPGSPMACGLPSEMLSEPVRQWYAANGFHPTFFYEALWNIVGFLLLWFGGRRFARWLRDGDIFLLYLIWYPLGRFWVEMFRPDAWRMGALATAQWIAIACIAGAIAGLVLNHRRPRTAGA
ncbi:MAG: prolipoprotein diacylglyceryl transferase [Chloroflexi bacterium]|nr:prolipoprotein diacylglyceryl transferase [Chloroflexota bacterium]